MDTRTNRKNRTARFKPAFLQHYERGTLPISEMGEHKVILRRLQAQPQTREELTEPSVKGARVDEFQGNLRIALQTLLLAGIVRCTKEEKPVYHIAPEHEQHVRVYLKEKH